MFSIRNVSNSQRAETFFAMLIFFFVDVFFFINKSLPVNPFFVDLLYLHIQLGRTVLLIVFNNFATICNFARPLYNQLSVHMGMNN